MCTWKNPNTCISIWKKRSSLQRLTPNHVIVVCFVCACMWHVCNKQLPPEKIGRTHPKHQKGKNPFPITVLPVLSLVFYFFGVYLLHVDPICFEEITLSLDEQMELPNLEVSALPSHLHIEHVPSEPWQWTDGKRFSHGKKTSGCLYLLIWEILPPQKTQKSSGLGFSLYFYFANIWCKNVISSYSLEIIQMLIFKHTWMFDVGCFYTLTRILWIFVKGHSIPCMLCVNCFCHGLNSSWSYEILRCMLNGGPLSRMVHLPLKLAQRGTSMKEAGCVYNMSVITMGPKTYVFRWFYGK